MIANLRPNRQDDILYPMQKGISTFIYSGFIRVFKVVKHLNSNVHHGLVNSMTLFLKCQFFPRLGFPQGTAIVNDIKHVAFFRHGWTNIASFREPVAVLAVRQTFTVR